MRGDTVVMAVDFSWRSLHAIKGLGLEYPVSDSDQ